MGMREYQALDTMFGDEIFVHYEYRREVVVANMKVTFGVAQWAYAGDPAIKSDWMGITFAIFKELLHVAAGEKLRWPEVDTVQVFMHLGQFLEPGGRLPVTSNFRLIEADDFASMQEMAEKAQWEETSRIADEAEAAHSMVEAAR